MPIQAFSSKSPHLQFQGRVKSGKDISYITQLAQRYFPDTECIDLRRLRLNTHPHFLTAKDFKSRLNAFLSLTADSLPPLLNSLVIGKDAVRRSWFLLARLQPPALKDWLEIHPDIQHGGILPGTQFSRETVRISDTEALTRVCLSRQ